MRRPAAVGFTLLLGLFPLSIHAADDDEPRRVAEQYLNALTGEGDEGGKELLLGGATMNAQLFSLENWQFASKDPVEKETGDLKTAVGLMRELDNAGHRALTQMMNGADDGDEMGMTELSQAEAAKLLAPTKERAARFSKACPVLAFATRVGKEVYWHPKNPMRAVIAQAGTSGKYSLELHRWNVLSKEGPRKAPRKWPLRVVRFRSAKLDTGWKVIPASDWNAE